jgi:dihydrolipoamide dehydrogenase
MKYDVIFIGAGLNYVGAIFLARSSKKVALIEKDLNHIGGTCLNNGCIPSKKLLHRTKTLFETKEEYFTPSKLDIKKLVQNIESEREKLVSSVTKQIKVNGIELIEGEAKLISKNEIKINDKTFEADYIVIATGAKPFIPDGIEIDYKKIITSDEALHLEKLPKEIMIYGGGAIALEFAGYFAINGVKTTLVYRRDNFKMHEKISQNLKLQLQKIGVELKLNTSIKSAKADKKVEIITDNDEKLQTEILLVATGRRANLDFLKYALDTKKGAINTNQYFQTSEDNIFAIGDCNGKLLLAHAARKEAMAVADFLNGKKEVLNLNNIPKFIFTLPLSYASIGVKSEEEIVYPLKALGVASAVDGAENGVVVIYYDKDKFITGAELFMPNAEELISVFGQILAGEMDVKTALNATFPHPTFSEIFDYALRKI